MRAFLIGLFLLCAVNLARAEKTGEESTQHLPVGGSLPVDSVPDLRETETPLKYEPEDSRNFFAVPIPVSSPTFGTGLILVGAYFYPQTPEEKETQPASFTGVAAGYTDSDSWFAGITQQNYLDNDRWRINGAAAYADLRLETVSTDGASDVSIIDWLVKGSIFSAGIDRQIAGDFYVGASLRYLDVEQDVDLVTEPPDLNSAENIQSLSLGLTLQYDSRDLPSNAYTGQLLEVEAALNGQHDEAEGSYGSYYARFNSYHQLLDPLVLALEVNGCARDGRVPLWDACRLSLRGFSTTRYLSGASLQTQAELRWRFYRNWGAVAFAGAGWVDDALGGEGEDKTIPSYGLGLRWMVLESKRINLRVDYARSDEGESAWYLSVSEAF